jgi:hypothetical protein
VKATLPRRTSRASQPGSSGSSGSPGTPPSRRRAGWLAAIGLLAVIAAAASLYLARSAAGTPAAGKYGGLPSWLPTSTIPVGRIAAASPAHPWLAVEGDTVRVRLARGQALATAVGPAVPEEGAFPVPASISCTFTITFASVSGTIPLSPAAFTILDELGHLHHPLVAAHGGGPVPADATAGKTLTLTVTAVLPTGSGTLRWAPTGGSPVVSWDFDVEID